MKITVLGATGSIGVSTLDVVARHPDRFEVLALTGHSRVEVLAEQCRRFRPAYAVVGAAGEARRLVELLGADSTTEVSYGEEALCQVATLPAHRALLGGHRLWTHHLRPMAQQAPQPSTLPAPT